MVCSLKYHALVGFTVLALTGIAARARAAIIPFTPTEANLSALTEAAITTNDMMIQHFGLSPGSELFFSGSYTDTGWSMTMLGHYSGGLVDLSFTGGSGPIAGSGTFTSGGSINSILFQGSSINISSFIQDGSYSFNPLSVEFPTLGESVNWKSSLTSGFVQGNTIHILFGNITSEFFNWFPDRNLPNRINDNGLFIRNTGGVATGIRGEVSSRSELQSSRLELITMGIVDPNNPARITSREGILSASFDNGVVSGVVATVPEPSAFALAVTGALYLIACGWMHRKAAGGRGKVFVPRSPFETDRPGKSSVGKLSSETRIPQLDESASYARSR